jgi:hypothetical protein
LEVDREYKEYTPVLGNRKWGRMVPFKGTLQGVQEAEQVRSIGNKTFVLTENLFLLLIGMELNLHCFPYDMFHMSGLLGQDNGVMKLW